MTPNINLRCDYFDHPKTRRLVGLLGRGAEVLPIRLWTYCGMFHAKDGKLSGYSEPEIESLAGWWGSKGAMLPALEAVNYAQREADEKTWCMTDWMEHQGHIEALKVRARKGAAARWKKYRSNAAGTAKAMLKQSSNQPSDLPRSGGRKKRDRGSGEKFPVPKGEPLPTPLYRATAEAMVEACRKQVRDIRAKAKKTAIHGRTGEGTPVVLGYEIEAEAMEAIALWQQREEDILRALAG